jgi:6-phosphogluconolactonase
MHVRLMIGTYTRGTGSQGIYAAEWDERAGTLALVGVAAHADDPSYLVRAARSPRRVYAALETTDFTSTGEGAIAVYELIGDVLEECHRCASGGGLPCALAFDPRGEHLAVANYGGTVALFGIGANGDALARIVVLPHSRGSVHPQRQKTGHPHGVTFVAESELWVPDLGADATFRYRLDDSTLTLLGEIASLPGSGPRLVVAHPTLPVYYLVHELSNEVSVFSSGEMLQRIDTLEAGFTGRSFASDIHITRDGRHLYVANRGEESIVGYRTDAQARLTVCTRAPTGGAHPRAFALTPDERHLLVANRDTNAVTVLWRDPETGALSPPSTSLAIPAPACLLFVT